MTSAWIKKRRPSVPTCVLKADRTLVCVIDGGGGLRRALREVFGDQVLIQRCQLHKMRNVNDHLPKKAQGWAHGSSCLSRKRIARRRSRKTEF